jgi:hypothetical protein
VKKKLIKENEQLRNANQVLTEALQKIAAHDLQIVAMVALQKAKRELEK